MKFRRSKFDVEPFYRRLLKARWGLLIPAVFYCTVSWAQAPAPVRLSFEQIFQQAIEQDPTVAAFRLNESASARQHQASLATWYPTLEAFAKQGELRTIFDPIDTQNKESSYGLQISYLLFSGFSSTRQNDLAWIEYQRQKVETQLALIQLQTDILALYGQVYLAEKELSYNQRIFERTQAFAKIAKIKYEQGTEALWVVQMAETEIESLQSEIKYTQAKIKATREEIRLKTAVASDFLIEPLRYPPVESFKMKADLNAHPRLQKLELETASLQKSADEAKSDYWPQFSVGYKTERIRQNEAPWSSNQGWTALGSWNIFTGLSTVNQSRALILQKESVQVRLRFEKQQLEKQSETQLTKYENALARLLARQKLEKIAVTRLEVIENQFRAGRRSYADYENAQNYLSTVQRMMLQAETSVIDELVQVYRIFPQAIDGAKTGQI